MSVGDESEGFAARWSRRKQEAKAGIGEADDVPVTDAPAPEAAEAEPLTEEQILEKFAEEDPELASEIAAIDIETLTYDDDFTIFMKEKVPDFIRRRALNHLYAASPIFSELDGLNEYDDDYTDAAMLVGEFKSAWQPGKGYARPEQDDIAELATSDDAIELAEDDEADAVAEDEPATEDGADETGPDGPEDTVAPDEPGTESSELSEEGSEERTRPRAC